MGNKKVNGSMSCFGCIFSCALFIFIICMGVLFLGAVSKSAEENSSTSTYVAPEPKVMYYKTIPVEVVDIKNTWNNAKTNTYIYSITVKSEEYGLNKTLDISNGYPYFYKAYTGQIKPGDIINAELISYKQGDTVTERYINQLKK